ncbi:MAG: PhnD/SsuA/transferrin family substrate-binding protein [Wenzhouxiangellaceae bacterium]|nr:PhnD/SsuA/transferrin family substrate-binding protein [Wenzhouxiangellaceae bacterium]
MKAIQKRAKARLYAALIALLAVAGPAIGQHDEVGAQLPPVEEQAIIDPAQASAEPTGAAPDSTVTIQSLTGKLGVLVNPVYPPEQARLVYQPLIDYLNETTELEFELVVERNFHRYWINTRRNEVAPLVLEDAHMAAWRMRNFDYRPLVKTSKPLTFSLLTSGAFADDSLNDFIGRRVSSLPSPSLGYLVLASWFGNPLQQPLILSTATSWLDAVEMVFSAEADAAIAPDYLVQRYPNLYPVETSIEFPGLTLSAAPDMPEDIRRILVEALEKLHDDPDHHAALFELDIDQFIAADPAEYEGLEDWLSTIFTL